jgi:hypothetical protein
MADTNKRNIPIQFNRDFSVIDSEFSSIRERFDNEMKRMEDGKCTIESKQLIKHWLKCWPTF